MLFGSGLDVRVGGPPRQEIYDCEWLGIAGLVGSDYPGLRLKPAVEVGARVRRGDAVLEDRTHPEVKVVAPVSGVVEDISIGPKRRVSAVTFRIEGDEAQTFKPDEDPGAFLRETGLWSALIQRPFGRVPEPGTRPDAIFIAATDTEPNAPDPAVVIGAAQTVFARGAGFLTGLTDGPVFVCQSPGMPAVEALDRLHTVVSAGAHPAGLAGTHIDRHFPVNTSRLVWQIGYTDVLALGEVLETGRLPARRTIGLGGPMANDPRLVRVPPGADIEALAAQEATPGPRRVLSGSALSGAESRFLRRHHSQVTLLPRAEPARTSRWMPETVYPVKHRPFVPHAALERALGPRVPVIPLLRALAAGDAEQSARLGALKLIEEDMALATYLSGGTDDFGAALRRVLDRLEHDK